MKFICSKSYLQEAAILSEKISGKNPTLPILNAVLMSAEDKWVRFFSTNLEMGIEITVPAKIKKNGSAAVPSKLLSSFISSLPETEVNIDTVNDNLLMTTEQTSTTIRCFPVQDFPIIPKIKAQKTFKIESREFINGLKSVYYSASLSEIKPEINSVYVYAGKNNLAFAATDSFRLGEKTISVKLVDISFLIPYRTVIEVIRIFENKDEEIEVKTDDNNILIQSNSVKFTSRLVEGNFPDYKQIIPDKFSTVVTLNKRKFQDSLKSAAVFLSKLNEVRLKVYKNDNILEIQTKNPDLGDYTSTVSCKTEGEDISTVFNYRYLSDCFSSVAPDDIVLRFSGEGKPLLVSGLNNTSFRYLVMPMKDI